MTVVLGARGQLGTELQRLLGTNATFLDRQQLDLSEPSKLENAIRELKPKLVFNAAAYTAVDKAESEQELAFKINAYVPGILADLSKKVGFKFLHVSTDYVFDGESSIPYRETDPVRPVNIYGQSKAEGERRIIDSGCNAVIVRTAWVHSIHGKSFLNTVLRLGNERKPMKVVDNAVGSPTWARDLANVLTRLTNSSGIFHFSNEGLCSWYDFACAIRRFANLNMEITPVPSSAFPTPAKRPKFSLLDKTKIKTTLGIQIPHWMESVEQCLKELS